LPQSRTIRSASSSRDARAGAAGGRQLDLPLLRAADGRVDIGGGGRVDARRDDGSVRVDHVERLAAALLAVDEHRDHVDLRADRHR
jgi:hypothetical protein